MRFSTTTIVPLAIVVVLGLLAGGIDLGNRLAAQEKTAGEVSTESGKPDDKSANKAEAVDDSSEEKPAEEEEYVEPDGVRKTEPATDRTQTQPQSP